MTFDLAIAPMVISNRNYLALGLGLSLLPVWPLGASGYGVLLGSGLLPMLLI